MNFFDNPAQTIQTTQPGDGSFTETKKAAEAEGYKVLHYNAGVLAVIDLTGIPVPRKDGSIVHRNVMLSDLWGTPKTMVYFSGVDNAMPNVQNMIQRMVEQRTMPAGEKIPLDTVVVATTA